MKPQPLFTFAFSSDGGCKKSKMDICVRILGVRLLFHNDNNCNTVTYISLRIICCDYNFFLFFFLLMFLYVYIFFLLFHYKVCILLSVLHFSTLICMWCITFICNLFHIMHPCIGKRVNFIEFFSVKNI